MIEVKPVNKHIVDELGRPYPAGFTAVKRSVYVIRLINEGSLIEKPAHVEKQKEKGDK